MFALAALYAFVGFEAAAIPPGNPQPRRAIPLALLGTVALITLTYVLVQLSYMPLISSAATAAGGSRRASPWAVGGDPDRYHRHRLGVRQHPARRRHAAPTAALADERRLPAFSQAFRRHRRAHASTWSMAHWPDLRGQRHSSSSAVVSSLARLFVYAASAAAVTAFDRRDGRIRPIMGIAVPLVVLSLCGWAAAQSSGREWATLAAFVATGTLLYFVASRRP